MLEWLSSLNRDLVGLQWKSLGSWSDCGEGERESDWMAMIGAFPVRSPRNWEGARHSDAKQEKTSQMLDFVSVCKWRKPLIISWMEKPFSFVEAPKSWPRQCACELVILYYCTCPFNVARSSCEQRDLSLCAKWLHVRDIPSVCTYCKKKRERKYAYYLCTLEAMCNEKIYL